MQFALAIAGWAALSILAAGCRRGAATARPRVTLGVSLLRISLPVFAAIEHGHLRTQGLDVEVRTYPTAQPMVDDVVAGRIDAAGFAAYPIIALASQSSAMPVRLATSLVEDADHRLSYVLARRGSALRFPRDAAGRRIGILPTVAYRRWLDAILRAAGITTAAVTVVPIAPPMQAQALSEGQVDLLFTNDPMATTMIARGAAEIVDDGPPCATRLGAPFAFGAFVISGELASRRPAVASALVRAIDAGIHDGQRDEAGARRAMATYLRPEERASVDRYPATRFLDSRETPADAVAREWGREVDWGILPRVVGVQAWRP